MEDSKKHTLDSIRNTVETASSAEAPKAIQLYLISGFLGAGKTTLLKEILSQMPDSRVGVLVNEFGAIGIDGGLIKKDGMKLVEINHGSIFCSCLKGEFVNALIEFTQLPIDILIIENSGLADPSNFHALLEEIAKKLHRPYCYKGAVCMVDAISFIKRVRILTPVQNQVISSHVIIINKMDLVERENLRDIKRVIREITPNSVLVETSYARIDWDWIKLQLCDNGYTGSTSNRPWNRPASYSIQTDQEVSVAELEQFIQALPVPILRAKGFLYEKGMTYFLDATQELWSLEPCKALQIKSRGKEKGAELVLILDGDSEWKMNIASIWFRIFGFAASVYE